MCKVGIVDPFLEQILSLETNLSSLIILVTIIFSMLKITGEDSED